MKTLILFFVGILFVFHVNAQVNPNNHYVNGFTKSNGTQVKGHYKTNPNNTINDNYTTKPNVNPYTGKAGTINPTSAPAYRAPTYSAPSPVYKAPSTTYKAPAYKTPATTYKAPKPIWP